MSYFLGAFNLASREQVRSRSALILGEPGFAMYDRGTERVGGRCSDWICGNVICRDPHKRFVGMQVSSDRLTRLIDIGKFEEENPPSLRVFNYMSEYFYFYFYFFSWQGGSAALSLKRGFGVVFFLLSLFAFSCCSTNIIMPVYTCTHEN